MVTVSVSPPEAFESRTRLFAALAEALAVRIVPGGGPAGADASASIVFGGHAPAGGLPTLVLPSSAPEPGEHRVDVEFAGDLQIDRTLRGASLRHRALPFEELPDTDSHSVLARAGRVPVWVRSGSIERLAVGLSDLGEAELLRERMQTGRFLPLVPIVDFLRRADTARAVPPPQHAAFLFDDPNLHSTSYGFLDYRFLAADAARHGYHVAFATVPLDAWHASRAACELFRANRRFLSLIVHGNTHVRRELAQPLDRSACRALLRQGLERIERFERRYRVPVGRVMAPPHNAISETMAEEIPGAGYDALCVSQPYAWLESAPPDLVLAGWAAIEIVASGLPVIPRVHFSADPDEIVLRAFLRQPLVVYGHHGDVRDGLDVLREAADRVNRVGDVRWASLDEIVSRSYETRVDGDRLHLRLYARRALVVIPEGIAELTVERPHPTAAGPVLIDGRPEDEFDVSAARNRTVEVHIPQRDSPSPGRPAPARLQVWPYARRGLAETRDRLLPRLPRR
jgi:hypothetical protein